MIITGGGRADRPGRIIFNATYTFWSDVFLPNSYLYTFYKIRSDEDYRCLQYSIDRGDRILIDSGTHSIYMAMVRNDERNLYAIDRSFDIDDPVFADYFSRYCDFAKTYEPYLWGYIELDLGNQDQKTILRQRMQDRGLKPIPVYHPLSDDLDYLDDLAQDYDRVCFGNIAMEDKSLRQIFIQVASLAKSKYPGLWVHLLGFAPDMTLAAFPGIDSVDTTTSSSIARFGHFDEGSCFNRRYGIVDGFHNRRKDRPNTELAFASGFRSYLFHSVAWNNYHAALGNGA